MADATIELAPHGSYLWKFAFINGSDGSPIDISGRVLTFTAKRGINDPNSSSAIQTFVECPSDSVSAAGVSYLFITPDMTAGLVQDETLHCQFLLTWTDSLSRVNNKPFGYQKIKAGRNLKATVPTS